MSSTMPSGTRSPLSRNRLTCWPRSVSRETWSRSRSPVAICGTPKCSAMSRPWVPLPAPGAASINTRKASSLEQGMSALTIPHPAVRNQQTVRPTLLRTAGISPASQRTSCPTGQGQPPQGDPHLSAAYLVSPRAGGPPRRAQHPPRGADRCRAVFLVEARQILARVVVHEDEDGARARCSPFDIDRTANSRHSDAVDTEILLVDALAQLGIQSRQAVGAPDQGIDLV